MKGKIILGMFLVTFVLLLTRNVLANSENRNPGRRFDLPDSAQKVSDGTYYLGKANDVDGTEVEGYAIIRRRDGQVRPVKPPKPTASICYGFLASGAKWKNVEDWVVNPQNTSTLSASFVSGNLSNDISKWESAAANNILGSGTTTNSELVADTNSPDGVNEVYFADISDSNAIAITIVWGVFGGPTQYRKLVEWDQVYDDVDYPWSGSGELGKMDFENIATHELGHSVGLNDQYQSICSEVTMYGYANYGEIKKQTLELPDILGVRTLYQ